MLLFPFLKQKTKCPTSMEGNFENCFLLLSIVIISSPPPSLKWADVSISKVHLTISLSQIMFIWLNQTHWFKYDETWHGYPLQMRNWLDRGPCALIFSHQWSKVTNQNHAYVWYCPNLCSDFDETLQECALVLSDGLLMLGMWPNFQGHWGQIHQYMWYLVQGRFS